MTKLDDILRNTANNIAEDVVTGRWTESRTKQAVKDLILELIGEDEKFQCSAGVFCDDDMCCDRKTGTVEDQNALRAKLRKKVEKL